MINQNVTVAQVNAMRENTMIELLGIEVTEIGKNYISGKMPVDKRTHQPAGLLHGGASAAMIESLGSLGSSLIVDMSKFGIVGIEINANHIRGVQDGFVTAKVEIIHCGKSTHIWQGYIYNGDQKLVCSGRLTVLVIEKPV
ncbi:MAG: hotdog fold thioesterase [Crocinitomicaceae bacterium]|nr:hotdog fold thioesterase [Crocinitomicaceae bacterium]